MNRRTRTIIVLTVAVVLASLASFGVYRAILNIPRVEVPIATNFAVVAKDRIPVGVLIGAEHVKVVPWPADTPMPAGFTKAEDVVGRGVIDAFEPNEPILEAKLAARNMGGGMPPMIPQGMRAMSVRVNDVVAVAGFTQPGTRVDVIVTLKMGEAVSRVVLSNVQVLTANTRYKVEKGQQGQPTPISIITFLLTPQDAEKLALAQNEGPIMLALRNPLDVAQTETTGARIGSLMGAPAPPPVARVVGGQRRMVPTPPPPPPPPPPSVEMVKAGKRGEVIIR